MDRIIVYPAAIPQDSDILSTNRNAMIAIDYLGESVFGSSTFVSGLACLPTSPTADLNVHVQRGTIGQLSVIDTTAYGSLAADTSDPLFKMGINTATTNFAITPPSTAGYSQNYLIEAQLLESDVTPVVLPYYNSSNPAVPYSGPSNSGTAQNTLRQQRVSLQLKAGVPAAAGTQLTPSVDAGWVALWIVSVNNGQTQITSTSITMAPGAPFVGTTLRQQRTKLAGNLTLYVTSAGNDLNSGLSYAVAFATPQAAWNSLVNNYDLNGYNATIQMGAGTYTGNTVLAGTVVGLGSSSVISLLENAGAINTVVLNSTNTLPALQIAQGINVAINGFTLTAASGQGLNVQNGAGVTQFTVAYGACATHMVISGSLTIGATYNITGGGASHYQTYAGGQINVLGSWAVNLSGTPAFGTAFAYANSGCMFLQGLTFTGSATGPHYSYDNAGCIVTGGGGASYLPGSTSGITTGFGKYS